MNKRGKPSQLLQIRQTKTECISSIRSSSASNINSSPINYICIDHDPQLQTNSEIEAIKKNTSITQSKGLTLSVFKQTLELQPERLHLTYHGEYDESKNESFVIFDRIPVLPQLLTSNKTFLYNNRTEKYYRDYIAAIARLFEEEMLRFINQTKNEYMEPIISRYTCFATEGIFDQRIKLRQLLQNIAERRFGCSYCHYRDKKFVAIMYGKWSRREDINKDIMERPPNIWLLDEYRLSSLCSNRQIDGILRQIKTKYKRIAAMPANNTNLIENMNNEYQLYCWTIMNIAINCIIPNEVWIWLDSLNDDDINDDNTNNGELYDAFSRTFELTVSPQYDMNENNNNNKNNKKLRKKSSETEQKICEQRIQSILKEILKNIRQDTIASNGREYESPWLPPPLLNYKILRFHNKASIDCVGTNVIAQMQRKYKGKYIISFRELSKASIPSYLLCGYVPLNDQKKYRLDEIAPIIRDTLISRDECKIKLLSLLGCHSYELAKLFTPYIECIICVHPKTEIDDNICVKFSRYFYQQLAGYGKDEKNAFKYIVKEAFDRAMKRLRRSYKENTACQFHQNMGDSHNNEIVSNDGSILSLKIVRCDRTTHDELREYVNCRLFGYNQFNQNEIRKEDTKKTTKKTTKTTKTTTTRKRKKTKYTKRSRNNGYDNDEYEADDIYPDDDEYNDHIPPYIKPSSRGGNSLSIDCQQNIYDTNNNHQRRSISIESISLTQSKEPKIDIDDLDNNDYGAIINKIEWEWYECKTRPHFSYSMIKCDTKERKNKIFKLLKEKQREEEIKMNRILAEEDTIGALLSDTDNGGAINLRWDVTELPKCSCPPNIPHRVEDELILLINGKHIKRDIKLPGNDKNVTRRAISLPPTATTSIYKTFKDLKDDNNKLDADDNGYVAVLSRAYDDMIEEQNDDDDDDDISDNDYDPGLSIKQILDIPSTRLEADDGVLGIDDMEDNEERSVTCNDNEKPLDPLLMSEFEQIINNKHYHHNHMQYESDVAINYGTGNGGDNAKSKSRGGGNTKSKQNKGGNNDNDNNNNNNNNIGNGDNENDDDDKDNNNNNNNNISLQRKNWIRQIADIFVDNDEFDLFKTILLKGICDNHSNMKQKNILKQIEQILPTKETTEISQIIDTVNMKEKDEENEKKENKEEDEKKEDILNEKIEFEDKMDKKQILRGNKENINKRKSYDPAPFVRAKYNIKIEKEFTKQIGSVIKENINELYGYIDKITGVGCHGIFNDGNIKIINYDFHDNKTNEALYCILYPFNIKNEDKSNNNNNIEFKWRMMDKLYTAKEIDKMHQISPLKLPKSWRTSSEFKQKLLNENKIRNKLMDPKQMENIIKSTPWHKIPIYNRNHNKKRIVLCLNKPEFIKKLRDYNFLNGNICNTQNMDLIPIMMFDTMNATDTVNVDKATYYIEYVWIVSIDNMDNNDTNIGISFIYNQQKDIVTVSGIHLDEKYLKLQHQLISTQHECDCFDSFTSNITHLEIGNPDDDKNRIKDLKNQIFNLKKEDKEKTIEIKKLKTMQENMERIQNENEKLKAIINKEQYGRHSPSHSQSISMSHSAITPTPTPTDNNNNNNNNNNNVPFTVLQQQNASNSSNSLNVMTTMQQPFYVPVRTVNGDIVGYILHNQQ